MNKQEKKKFIKEYLKTLQSELIADVSKMPDNWDGVELRWLIEYRTRSSWGDKVRNIKQKKLLSMTWDQSLLLL